jgi:hypothetical protein
MKGVSAIPPSERAQWAKTSGAEAEAGSRSEVDHGSPSSGLLDRWRQRLNLLGLSAFRGGVPPYPVAPGPVDQSGAASLLTFDWMRICVGVRPVHRLKEFVKALVS